MVSRVRWRSRRREALAGSFNIRLMVRDDRERVLELYSEYAGEEFGELLSYDRWGPGVPVPYSDDGPEPEDTEPRLMVGARLDERLAGNSGLVLVGGRGGDLAAFLIASRLGAGGCWSLDDLYVARAARRQGLGTALVEDAVARLRTLGSDVTRVDIDRRSRGARRFWAGQSRWAPDLRSYRIYQ